MIAFEYKCRRCGEVEKGPRCDVDNMGILHLQETINNSKFKSLMNLEMHHIHICKDGGGGVMDLIGYGIVKEGDEVLAHNGWKKSSMYGARVGEPGTAERYRRPLKKGEAVKKESPTTDVKPRLFDLVYETFFESSGYHEWVCFAEEWEKIQ
jgi:hypothetical protein